MTEAQKELYIKTKKRLRRLGTENPADVIVALAEEIERYRTTIGGLKKELDTCECVNKLLECDIEERDKMLEQKVEEVYPEFMSDYKLMQEELEGVYEELAELKTERDALGDALLSEKAKMLNATERMTPKKPTYVDTRFRNHGRHVSDGCSLDKCYKCPNCKSHIFHVFDSEKYCNKCGQALDWSEEAKG